MAISHIKKWGNSFGIRIPQSLLAQLNLQAGGAVEIILENGRLILAPVKSTEYSLDDLLSQITSDNLHGESDFGRPVGNEVW